VLVVDDERPALDELAYLLNRDPRVGEVRCCNDPTAVPGLLQTIHPDLLLLDIAMPGLTGLELAESLRSIDDPPPIVFVTAHTEHATTAFDLQVVDYVLKPVAEQRLRQAIRRVLEVRGPAAADTPDVTIPVELGGVTTFIQRSDVRYIEAHGDYSRLYTARGSHLVRSPLASLADQWADAGFLRIHRSIVVAIDAVHQLRVSDGRCTVLVDGRELPVSRRLAPVVREQLRTRGLGGAR
jgi:DNA-binding LytR/AlgR family response regulator